MGNSTLETLHVVVVLDETGENEEARDAAPAVGNTGLGRLPRVPKRYFHPNKSVLGPLPALPVNENERQ